MFHSPWQRGHGRSRLADRRLQKLVFRSLGQDPRPSNRLPRIWPLHWHAERAGSNHRRYYSRPMGHGRRQNTSGTDCTGGSKPWDSGGRSSRRALCSRVKSRIRRRRPYCRLFGYANLTAYVFNQRLDPDTFSLETLSEAPTILLRVPAGYMGYLISNREPSAEESEIESAFYSLEGRF